MLDPHTKDPWLPNSLLTFFCDTMLPWFEANRPDLYNSFLVKRKVASIEEYRGSATSTDGARMGFQLASLTLSSHHTTARLELGVPH